MQGDDHADARASHARHRSGAAAPGRAGTHPRGGPVGSDDWSAPSERAAHRGGPARDGDPPGGDPRPGALWTAPHGGHGRGLGLVQFSSPLVAARRYAKQIADFTAQHQPPAISPFNSFVEAGGLMAYGPNLAQFFGHVAVSVDKILRGAKPAELPVEQPRKFELVIDLKTAQTLA
jgi:hypothetical protein